MQSSMSEFYRVLNSATELNLKQDDAAAKRAAAVRQANTAAQMRAVMARYEANQPAPPIPTPNTSLSSVGNINDLPLEEGTKAQPGDMGGGSSGPAPSGGPADLMPGGGKGKKPATPFGESARPGMSDTAAELRELGETLIIGGDFKTGRQYIDSAVKAEKRAAEIDTEQLKQQADMADMLGSIAGSVHDQQSFTNALMIAGMHGMADEAAQIYQMTGGQYGPQAQAILSQFADSSMSVKQQAQVQIDTAKLANDNRRTESIIAARNVSMIRDKQAMGIARERLDLSKGKAKAKDPVKHGKSFEFDRTMEAAGIKPGSADYIKAARIKARLEKGAGGSSLTDEISKMLGEDTADAPSVLTPPGKDEITLMPKAEKKSDTPKTEAPAAAVSYLKEHPELKEAFKKKYGYLPE